ncbi:MAG: Mur ligase family protein [Treponema sp.]
MRKFLSELLPAFAHQTTSADGITAVGDEDIGGIEITDIVFDSRAVRDGALYFALPGTHIDGREFIPEAVKNGAAAVVFQGELRQDIRSRAAEEIAKSNLENTSAFPKDARKSPSCFPAFIKVENARFSMSPVSAAFYDNPSAKLAVVGVTGTEGKSSTVSFIWQLLRLAGKKAGFISTVEYSFGGEALANPEHQTTPEAPIIQRHLAEMVKNGCEYAVIESSSHGLSQKTNRLGDVLFDCGVFMNVTLEHLEFHKTFEQYRSDKANLFRALDAHNHKKLIGGKSVSVNSIGIANLGDPSAQYFIDSTKKRVYGFTSDGRAGKAAAQTEADAVPLPPIPAGIRYVRAQNIVEGRGGLDFTIETDTTDAVFHTDDNAAPRAQTSIPVRTPFSGAFNAYNIMAALIAVSSLTEKPFAELSRLVPELKAIKGRMTAIDAGQPFEVIVDYAHTPSSFETIFPPVRKRCAGKMIALFGSGGERDLTKRPLQGHIAAKFCDIIILTDEDPRGEDSAELLQMIAAGAEKEGKRTGKDLFIIPDRKKAIREAFKTARAGDIVLLLGKSHENSIIYKDYVMPYDEISEAKAALSEMGFKGEVRAGEN